MFNHAGFPLRVLRGVGQRRRFLSVIRNNPQNLRPARASRAQAKRGNFCSSNATDAASAGRRALTAPASPGDPATVIVLTLHHPLPGKSNASHGITRRRTVPSRASAGCLIMRDSPAMRVHIHTALNHLGPDR